MIEADQIRVGSRVGGRVAEVLVREGDALPAGKQSIPLVRLDPYDLRERLAEAEAVLAQRIAQRDRLTAGYQREEIEEAAAQARSLAAEFDKLKKGPREEEIAAARAQLDAAAAQLELAEFDFVRIRGLRERNVATQAEFDQVTKAFKSARALHVVQEENLKLLQAGTRPEDLRAAQAALDAAQAHTRLLEKGYRKEDQLQAAAAVDAAKAARDAVHRAIDELVIRSPAESAVVEAIDLQPGDLVAPNAPVLSLLDTRRLWVRAYLPQSRLGVQVGDPVTVTVDSLPDERFAGRLSFISRDGEFTPGNIQTPEERSKQVFRIKVLIDDPDRRLRPGMTVDVWLDGADE
jgi:multidrug resistance efflux pump